MMVLVAYDVSTESEGGQRRLRRISKICLDYGQRVQYSVFECLVEPAQWTVFRGLLINEMDLEHDSLRFYFLGSNWRRKVEHVGIKQAYDPEGTLIV